MALGEPGWNSTQSLNKTNFSSPAIERTKDMQNPMTAIPPGA